jgi:hypothetical protein
MPGLQKTPKLIKLQLKNISINIYLTVFPIKKSAVLLSCGHLSKCNFKLFDFLARSLSFYIFFDFVFLILENSSLSTPGDFGLFSDGPKFSVLQCQKIVGKKVLTSSVSSDTSSTSSSSSSSSSSDSLGK